MNDQLHKLINFFLQNVLKAEELMKGKLNVDQPMCWRHNKTPRTGTIDKYTYEFHGIGCCFDFGDISVDYDYGDQGRIDGFDLWRLTIFGEQIKDFQSYVESGKIKIDFKECIEAGEIVQSSAKDDYLYYLSKSV
ncbi:MAG: hypothetical protein OEY09_09430 [Gammaproteobacteria bacterium]|nr:hypothetical protein [Gammaproteobacteria bacterium]